MSKEMLFLCDTYTEFLQKNNLPHRCASELLYSSDTMNKLTVSQTYWLENFISTWDIIALHAQETTMNTIKLTDQQLEYLQDVVLEAYSMDVAEQKDWDIQTFDNMVDAVCGARADYL